MKMSEIERIVREFIPHKDAKYIRDLVIALENHCKEKTNDAFNEGCAFEAGALGKERF